MDAKICLAIVTNRTVKPKTVGSLIELARISPQITKVVVATEAYTTAEGRAYSVIQAQRAECSHILFIDDDMIFPPDTLSRLLADEKPIVGVNSNSRTLPLSTTVMRMDENGEFIPEDRLPSKLMPNSLFQCYAVGMGVCLIEMSVFEKIEKPWFQFITNENGKVETGEDAFFCGQAKKAGIGVWCDPSIKVGHLGDYEF